MYAKLAWRNGRRSLRDYSIYFLTLVFAVAIFYVFNSLADQPAFLALEGSTRRMAQGMVQALGWLTTIMTGVVALLVLYANRVIIKKRNRELGTYLLLGMEQGRLALLLLAEVAMIGLAALLVGLGSGILLSQLFALLVNEIFAVGLTGFTFVFSPTAAVKTLLTYSLIFGLVGVWQAASIYRQRLIDLIIGARRNEEIRVRGRILSVTAGLLCVLALGRAYWLSHQVSSDQWLSPRDPRIGIGALLGIVGTYLLFVALAGLLTGLRHRHRGWIARGLNRFLYRQVTSKINTSAALLATITLMLTFTILAMSTGIGLGKGISRQADQQAPFDYAIFSTSPTQEFQPFLDLFDQYGATKRRAVQFTTAGSDLTGRSLMLPEDAGWFDGSGVTGFVADSDIQVISISAYRELRALAGYPAVDLEDGHYLIHGSTAQTEPEQRARDAFERFMASGGAVTLAGKALRPGAPLLLTEPLDSQVTGRAGVLVVPDEVASALPGGYSYLFLMLDGRAPAGLNEAVQELAESPYGMESGGAYIWTWIRAEVVGSAFVTEGMLLFLSLYIGVMFTLISATLLAIQQVADAVEHQQRFQVLRKLGADEGMINRVIRRQLGIAFLTPVVVALLHSLVAMVALSRVMESAAGYTTVWPATLSTLGIFGAIYGAYYLLSLQGCRAMFREPLRG